MKTKLIFSLFTCAVMLAGCGKKDDSAAPTASTAASPAATAGVTVEMTANDSMKFNLSRIEAKAGQDVKVILTNTGTLPKTVMGHNFVLLQKDVDQNAFAQAAVAAAATDYIPASMSGKIIAHTKLLGAKQSDEITFKAPTEPGEYPFLCSFPAHYQTGMKGVLVVQ